MPQLFIQATILFIINTAQLQESLRGQIQTVLEKINVIMTLGGRGSRAMMLRVRRNV